MFSFISVIVIVPGPVEFVKTQFADWVKVKIFSQ